MTILKQALPAATIALAAMFFAIAAYVGIVEQPARLALPDASLLRQWQISYGIAMILQGALAIVAGLAGLTAWWFSRDRRWLVGAILMLANWPWTLAVVAPINNALMATTAEAAGATSRALIEQWGQVHSVRTCLGLAAMALFLWAITRSTSRGSLQPS